MFSLAKKLLVPGRASVAQTSGSDARVRKYSLASAPEPLSPVFGTSYSLNPEHLIVTPEQLMRTRDRQNRNLDSGDTAAKKEFDIPGDGDVTDNAFDDSDNDDDHVTDNDHAKTFIFWPEISGSAENVGASGGSFGRIVRANKTFVGNSEFQRGRTEASSISSIDTEAKLLDYKSTNFQGLKGPLAFQSDRSATVDNSSLPVFAEVGYSNRTISSGTADSLLSLTSTTEVSSRFQQAKRKKHARDLKHRRKTVERIDLGGWSSADAVRETSSLSKSKSLTHALTPLTSASTPTLTDDELSYVSDKLKVVKRRSSAPRRRTIDDVVFTDEGKRGIQNSEVLLNASPFQGVLWSVSSSDDQLTDSTSVISLKTRQQRRGRRRTHGCGRGNFSAVAMTVSDIKNCTVVADLDLLEDNTEFEPCSMPSEDSIVLWPASVDKPSFFERPVTCRSWISNLEATGFVGDKCILMSMATISQGVQERAQLLFLFPRHMLFAEQKSNSLMRLDQKIEICSLWISDRKDDVNEISETDLSSDGSRSLVIGWPPVNLVITFATSEEKSSWSTQLQELMEVERAKLDAQKEQLSLKVVHKERGYSKAKEVAVKYSENSFQFLQRCIQEFHLNGNGAKEHQLFVKWAKDQHEVPLLGHESPYLIETWFLKCAASQSKENSRFQCLVLRERKQAKLALNEAGVKGRPLKSVPLKTLFKWSQPRTVKPQSLFGRCLSDICTDNSVPKRILAMFQYLYVHGPSNVGVFRKSSRQKEVNDFKAQLNTVEEVDFENVSVDAVASVIKEWLRNLPNCLLSCDLYNQWIDVSGLDNSSLIVEELKRLSSLLPPNHLLVLQHFMCVLHRIQLHSKYNRMTPFNLAVCIGPNILRPHASADLDFEVTSIERANTVVRHLIESIEEVLGSECVKLYQDIADPYLIEITEAEGDYELHTCQTSNSLESLSNDFIHETMTDGMNQSLETLSPDSGLAASNPQLYEEDALTYTTHSEGPWQQQDDCRSKSELSVITEDLIGAADDSDVASLSSKASDRHSSVSSSSSRMQSTRDDPEQMQNSKAALEELEDVVKSFDDQMAICSVQVGRSDSVRLVQDVGAAAVAVSNTEETRRVFESVVPTESRFETGNLRRRESQNKETAPAAKNKDRTNNLPSFEEIATSQGGEILRQKSIPKTFRLTGFDIMPASSTSNQNLNAGPLVHFSTDMQLPSPAPRAIPVRKESMKSQGTIDTKSTVDKVIPVVSRDNSPMRKERCTVVAQETRDHVQSHVFYVDTTYSPNPRISTDHLQRASDMAKCEPEEYFSHQRVSQFRQNEFGDVTVEREQHKKSSHVTRVDQKGEAFHRKADDLSKRSIPVHSQARMQVLSREVLPNKIIAAEIVKSNPWKSILPKCGRSVNLQEYEGTHGKMGGFGNRNPDIHYYGKDSVFQDQNVVVTGISYRHRESEVTVSCPTRARPSKSGRVTEDRVQDHLRNGEVICTSVNKPRNPENIARISIPSTESLRLNIDARTVVARSGISEERARPRTDGQNIDRNGLGRRRVTVIQLCDNDDTVIVQNTMKKS